MNLFLSGIAYEAIFLSSAKEVRCLNLRPRSLFVSTVAEIVVRGTRRSINSAGCRVGKGGCAGNVLAIKEDKLVSV